MNPQVSWYDGGVKLGMFVPTRGRLVNAVRLARQVAQTCNPRLTELFFVVDHDDPVRRLYQVELRRKAPWAQVLITPEQDTPRRLGPVLNWAVKEHVDRLGFVGFMGDDHYPTTPLWDEKLCRSLDGRPGVAYGNDLLQRENLPTACVISAELVRALGYMVPEPLVHLYLDDFWKTLGMATRLVYRGDVVIEHLHPAARKAPVDQVYLESGMSAELMRDDGWRWRQWYRCAWPGELERLKGALA